MRTCMLKAETVPSIFFTPAAVGGKIHFTDRLRKFIGIIIVHENQILIQLSRRANKALNLSQYS